VAKSGKGGQVQAGSDGGSPAGIAAAMTAAPADTIKRVTTA